MQIGKKLIERKTLEALEARIGSYKRAIENAKIISKGGSDGLKMALNSFKEYRRRIVFEREQCYDKVTTVKMLRASVFSGEEKALNIVINTFENHEENIRAVSEALAADEKLLNEWKKLPIRE